MTNREKQQKEEKNDRHNTKDRFNRFDKEKEPYRILRNYFVKLKKDDSKSIGFTSLSDDQEKVEVLLQICEELAANQYNTLLIDANYFDNVISEIFQLDSKKGLMDYLTQAMEELEKDSKTNFELAKDRYIYNTSIDYFNVMPIGLGKQEVSQLLKKNDIVGHLLTELKKDYDYILVEMPSFYQLSYVQLITEFIDETVFVLKAGQIKVEQAQEVRKQLESLSCHTVCCILKPSKKRARRINNLLSEIRKEEDTTTINALQEMRE